MVASLIAARIPHDALIRGSSVLIEAGDAEPPASRLTDHRGDILDQHRDFARRFARTMVVGEIVDGANQADACARPRICAPIYDGLYAATLMWRIATKAAFSLRRVRPVGDSAVKSILQLGSRLCFATQPGV